MLFCFQKSPADQAGPVSLPSYTVTLDQDQPAQQETYTISLAAEDYAAPAPALDFAYDDYDPTDVPADQARPDSAGTCPAPADTLQCAGAVSNCWSPGQRDTGPQ